ncbi:Uma2 family endonuclease [Dolichospermum sp. ST_con]|nr:Uma2 family endonuclease [Dolichospermum sp. ST_con]MDD1420163.1 Uma2 family endonuclease [Dolichospermum sp. ST_sed1]MDD1426399.1 Uma2 family endonuclease [Dolichospermum sp. ST_sed9]MDD1432951.1 Uma2 family endonuclease [Dolichospermum sp. ST_sed6]MDD1435959.1 Uma2 family endonuclease [Dolichospermum sp. ST_sed10]MDD1441696.1 Uma2 family endonuclease [Dolichospermum sp. ST_sed3]MDD1446027.1 Uma2 family endonuclease [Dolichospermum sp. ST_sed8]MDD1455658.1 Uma2 family endonuclease [Dolic
MVTIQLRQLSVPPGHRIILHNISWQEFEEILTELGENRASRLAYYQGILEIKMPLPKHEVAKVIIGDLVKIILEELEIDCECFGSTTFKRQDMNSGIEPDDSFYIKNHVQMIGKEKIDLNIDPPPDLVIEIDVTSKTQLDAYLALAVPEVWRYENDKLQINIWQDGKYIESENSPNFPDLQIAEIIPQFVEESRIIGRSPTLRKFRQWVKQFI